MKRSAEAELADQDAAKRRRRSEMNKELRELDEAGAAARLQELCDKWQLGEDGRSKTFEDQIMRMFRLFGLDYRDNMLASLDLDRGSFGLRELDDRINECELEAFGMYHRLRELRMLPETKEDTSPDKQLALRRIQKILEMTFHARRLVLSAFQAKLAVHQLHLDEGTLELAPDLDVRLGSLALKFRYIGGKMNDMQKLLLFLLDGAMEKRYRKSNGWMYEPIHLGGHNVHAWRPVQEIKDFVYSMLSKETHWEQWCSATQSGTKNISAAITYLTDCQDYQLPELRKMRAVYSFRNGVYLASEGRFHRFGERGEGVAPLGEDVVACKFIDQVFEEFPGTAWRDIPTPHLHSIMTYQGFSSEVCDWLYILLGRLLYPLNQHDSWQVIPFVKGVGSTGKCFAAGTRVLMHDGRRVAVERVRVGDAVMGDDGTPRRVLTLARGVSDMYSIVPLDGSRPPIVVTPEHVLCLVREPPVYRFGEEVDADRVKSRGDGWAGRGSPITMTVEEYLTLPEAERAALRCYRAERVHFAERPPPAVDPSSLAVWFVYRDLPPEPDLRDFETGLRACGLLAPDRGVDEYDLLDERVYSARVPECIMFGAWKTRHVFVRTLLAHAQHAERTPYRPPFDETFEVRLRAARASEALLHDIAFVARSLGMAAHVHAGKHTVLIGRTDCRARPDCRSWGFYVEPVPRQAYYGFETDGNHRFLLDDLTVTHNSTILLKVAKNFYDAMDVGVLSNNVERKFGLSAFHNKLLFVAPEVKADLCLEQAELQSVISGEDLQVNVKHKVAFSTTWDVPGILAGNEVPSWVDNGGSVQRRVIVWEFLRAVTNGDMKLGEKLEAELARIILKCNMAYRSTAERHSHVNIWTILPKYFHATRDTLAQSVNSVEAFLASPEVVKGEDLFCPMEDFRAALKTFEMRNNYKSKKYDGDFFMGPFGNAKPPIRIEKRVKKVYRGSNRTRDYIVGLDLNLDAEDNDLG